MEEGDVKRIRVVGLSFVVVVAASALVLTASASAEAPEFGRCVKVAKGAGAFKSANCTIPLAGGNYEWMPGPGPAGKFTTSLIPTSFVTLIETVGGTKIICTGEQATGEYTGTKTVGNVLLTFTGCETSGGQVESPGQPNGHVVSSPLEGVLGVWKTGETAKQNKIGLELFPQEAGAPVSQMACNGLPIVLRGSVITHVLTSNKMLLSSTIKYAQRNGIQKPDRFVAGPASVLEMAPNGGPFEQSGFAMEATQTNEEAIEVNSVF
jgi:hypothetical protein